jgi:Ca2+/Na+ antiporter
LRQDISGLGVFIAYIFQTVLTSIFGPLLVVYFWVINFRSGLRIHSISPLLKDLRKVVYETNAFFCMSLIIASFVRYHQLPTILEIIFMSELVYVQGFIVFVMLICELCCKVLLKEELHKLWILYYTAIMLTQMFESYSFSIPSSDFPIYYQIAVACHKTRHFVDISKYFAPTLNSRAALKWLLIGFAIGFAAQLGISVFMGMFYESLRRFMRRILPRWLIKNGDNLFHVLILVAYFVDLILDSRSLIVTRKLIRAAAGDSFQDDDWGYGQTTAVLLWAPFFWKLTVKGISELLEISQVSNLILKRTLFAAAAEYLQSGC